MREASKTFMLLTPGERDLLRGKGIDIGCGDDPVRPEARCFDVEQGDANRVTEFVRESDFDYVFSSHCLEHMDDPRRALHEWWTLVRPGGVLCVVVPDEDLYEQGYWPSLFNADHKCTFHISKPRSWSPVGHDLAGLARSLPDAVVLSIRVQDEGYRRAHLTRVRWPRIVSRAANRSRTATRNAPRWLRRTLDDLYLLLRVPIDQTIGNAVAQNLLLVKKARAPSS